MVNLTGLKHRTQHQEECVQLLPLSPELLRRMIDQARGSYRPKAIRDIKDKIASLTRAAELQASVRGEIDPNRTRYTLELKLELDALYVAWAEGRLA